MASGGERGGEPCSALGGDDGRGAEGGVGAALGQGGGVAEGAGEQVADEAGLGAEGEEARGKAIFGEDGWIRHPLHPTRARIQEGVVQIEQRVGRRFRFGPILSTLVMTWLERHTSWDADDDGKMSWSVAYTVMGDWPSVDRGMLQLMCGRDGRPGLRRKRKAGRIMNDLAVGWRGSRGAQPWLDLTTTGVVPLVLHYQPLAGEHPALWQEVVAMAEAALMRLPGRSAYQLARVLGRLPEPTGRCVYCGAGDLELTHDHAIALDLGGNPWGDNLVVACLRCNLKKGAAPLREWLDGLDALAEPEAIEAALRTEGQPRHTP